MIYFFEDGAFDDKRAVWCKENDVFYLNTWKVLFPVLVFIIGVLPRKNLDKILNSIVLFNKEDVMAYKLRWS